MKTDQRRFARKRTDQLLYAEFGEDNGSVLLNLSEDGCSFQSIAPVREQQVSFSVSVGDGRKLEGHGQMAWYDTEKKVGGLRFLNPSSELREQIREWLEDSLIPSKDDLHSAAVESKEKRKRRKLGEKARAEAELEWGQVALASNRAEAGRPDEWEFGTPLKSFTVPISLTGTRRVAGATVLAVTLCMAMVAYRRELGHLVMSFGSSIAGEGQKGDKAPPADVRPVAAGLEAKPEAKSSKANPDVRETADGGVVESAPGNTHQPEVAAKAATPTVQRVSVRQTVIDNISALWTSVENGDTSAEITLASRYLRGDGVPQSCAQARVLLEAAVKRGSAEARQKVGELGQAGCP
jgi:TPR repeat protein